MSQYDKKKKLLRTFERPKQAIEEYVNSQEWDSVVKYLKKIRPITLRKLCLLSFLMHVKPFVEFNSEEHNQLTAGTVETVSFALKCSKRMAYDYLYTLRFIQQCDEKNEDLIFDLLKRTTQKSGESKGEK